MTSLDRELTTIDSCPRFSRQSPQSLQTVSNWVIISARQSILRRSNYLGDYHGILSSQCRRTSNWSTGCSEKEIVILTQSSSLCEDYG